MYGMFDFFLTQEFFVSLHRDVRCCATGERVEVIMGDQTSRAVFTILPPEELGET